VGQSHARQNAVVVAYPGTEVARQSVISYVDAVRAEFTRVADTEQYAHA